MRKAEFDHAWKKCRSPSTSSLCVRRIDIVYAEKISEIPVTAHLAALIGPNGAGKTRFLKSLELAFTRTPNFISLPQINGIYGKYRGQDFSIVLGEENSSFQGPTAEFIDASLNVHKIMDYVSRQGDFDEVLEQYGFGEVRESELCLYRHVCRRNYNQIGIAEIEEPAEPNLNTEVEDDRVFPFFSVEVQNINYDSRAMGFGELCAFYIIWKACRAPKGSILLLDEPDSHLSPASRLGLFDVLAYLATQRHLWILFSSHTVETLHSLKESEMYLMYSDRSGALTRIDPVNTKRSIIRALGLYPIRRLLIVVEDVDAEAVIHQVLNRWGNDFSTSVDVQIINGGASEVIKFVKLFPQNAKICRVVPVLDGDKKGEFKEQENVLFLPTDKDPIEAARQEINKNCEHFALILGVEIEKLKHTLSNINHVNHHDFCSSLLNDLSLEGMDVSDIRSALIKAWVHTEAISLAAKDLADKLLLQLDMISLN